MVLAGTEACELLRQALETVRDLECVVAFGAVESYTLKTMHVADEDIAKRGLTELWFICCECNRVIESGLTPTSRVVESGLTPTTGIGSHAGKVHQPCYLSRAGTEQVKSWGLRH